LLKKLTLLASDWQVDLEYVRNGKVLTTSMFRMSVRRVQSIRDWMEVQSKNASHALAKADPVASQYSREMLEGMIMIVVEQYQFQETMLALIGQVCHIGKPLCSKSCELILTSLRTYADLFN